MVAAIEALNAGMDHPYYSLDNRFVGFNNPSEGGMLEGAVVSQVGATQTPTPESAHPPYIPEIGKGSIVDVWG